MISCKSLLPGLVLLLPCAAHANAPSLTFSPMAPPPNIIQNGDFNPGFSQWTLGGSGQSDVTSGGIYPVTPFGLPHQAQLTGLTVPPSFIGQSVPLVVGQKYDLTFWLAATGNAEKNFTVADPAGGTIFQDFSKSGHFGYTEFSSVFTAIKTNEFLKFLWSDKLPQNGNAFYLTDVSLQLQQSQTPPPPTLLVTLVGGMLGGLRLLRARRRRTAA